MIYTCPNCGYSLEKELNDGLAHCSHCHRVFDSSDYNRLLSAAWLVRRHNQSKEQLMFQMKIPEDEAILVCTFVGDHGYTHEDFHKLLVKLGVARRAYLNHSA